MAPQQGNSRTPMFRPEARMEAAFLIMPLVYLLELDKGLDKDINEVIVSGEDLLRVEN